MKKVLLATTILALSAPLALAEVTVSGDARMGVTYTEGATNELAFTSRIRIAFTASGETDGGLAFGGSVRADNAAGGAAGTAGSFFISGAFGKLTMGDVSGAAEFVVGDLHGVGLTGLGDTNENFYFSNGGLAGALNKEVGLPLTIVTDACLANPVVDEIGAELAEEDVTVLGCSTTVNGIGFRPTARYEYSTGGLTFAMSIDNPGNNVADVLENIYSVGVKYAVDSYAVSLGYETAKIGFEEEDAAGDPVIVNTNVGHIIAGAEATFSGVTVKATYGKASKLDFTQYGLSASYKMDALGISAFYRVEEFNNVELEDDGLGTEKTKFVGIGASYDLGGGASVVGGIANSKTTLGGVSSGSDTVADLGVSFTL